VTVVGDGQIGIAEQVRPAGLSTARPRYFEDEGLPTRAGRSQAGYRVYREDALHWVIFTQRQTTRSDAARDPTPYPRAV